MSSSPGSFGPHSTEAIEKHLQPRKRLAIGCMALVSIPFLLGGLALIFYGGNAFADGTSEDGPILLFMGAVSVAIGIVPLYSLATGGASFLDAIRLRQKYPNTPWLWRDDWASGIVRDTGRKRMLGAWVLALVIWGTAAMAYSFLRDLLLVFYEEHPLLTGSLSAVAAAALLSMVAHAVYRTLQWRKFGDSTLHLSMVPCPPGETVNGRVDTSFAEAPQDGCSIELKCVQVTTSGSGKNRSTTKKTIYTDTTRLDSFRLGHGMTGIYVPVSCPIPGDASPTWTTGDLQFHWYLIVTASLPGVDYHAEFELPVFRAGGESRLPR